VKTEGEAVTSPLKLRKVFIMKLKIILVKNVAYNFDTIIEADEFGCVPLAYEHYIVLSEAVEVDFPTLNNEAVVKSRVAIIDKQIAKIRADSEEAVTQLVNSKQELLALPLYAEQGATT
jgi:hypothetical protein